MRPSNKRPQSTRDPDLHRPKAIVAAKRLSGHHGLVIEPTFGSAQHLTGPAIHLISAVDTPDARQALQDRPQVMCR